MTEQTSGGLLALLSLLLSGVPAAPRKNPVPSLALGAKAPDFDLPGMDGKNHRLSDYDASPLLVVVFTCNHCPTAQYYEERIKQIAADYGPKGVALVAISPNDPESVRPDELGYTDLGDSLEEMKIRARDRGYNFPYLFAGAEHEAVSKAYGPSGHAPRLRVRSRAEAALRRPRSTTPSASASCAGATSGRHWTRSWPAREVQAPATTKSFGCSVKWSDKRAYAKEYWDEAREGARGPRDWPTPTPCARCASTARSDGKFRLVNFWATWCGPCLTEFPELMAIHRMYRLRDFEVVTVAANYPDEKADVLKWLQKNRAVTTNLLFADTDKYGLMEAFEPELERGPALHHPPRSRGGGGLQEGGRLRRRWS